MTISDSHTQQIASFLDKLLEQSDMELRYTISSGAAANAPAPACPPLSSSSPVPIPRSHRPQRRTALRPRADRHQILRLAPEEHDCISFDADAFKAGRTLALEQSAQSAIDSVRSTGLPFAFPPMSSRERRLLHLTLAVSGLPTASNGEAPRRYVVLYPLGYIPAHTSSSTATAAGAPPSATPNANPNATSNATQDRTRNIRAAFRRR